MRTIIQIFAFGSIALASVFLTAWSSSAAENTAFPLLDYQSEFPGLKLKALVSDGDQRVWAFAGERGSRLYRLEQKKWRAIELDGFPTDLEPLALERSPGGTLICLWQDPLDGNKLMLSQHDGDQHSLLARIPVKLSNPILLPLGNGGAIVTESGPQVVSVEPGSDVAFINVISEDRFVPPTPSKDGSVSTSYVPIRAVEDDKGTVWFWSHSMKESSHLWRLRFPLMLTSDDAGAKTLSAMKLPDVPEGSPISPMANRGHKVPALSVPGTGFFDASIDPDSTADLPDNALSYIENIFPACGSWYFITTPRPTKYEAGTSPLQNSISLQSTAFYNSTEQTSTLLRFHDGKFELLTRKFDQEPRFGWLDRPVVEMDGGFWTCVYKNKLAYISCSDADSEESIKYLDQQGGLPMRYPSDIERLNESEIVALDRSTGATCLISLENAFNQTADDLRLSLLESESALLEDFAGKIYGVLSDGKFSVWRDTAWHEWKIPDEVSPTGNTFFAQANKSHAWYFAYENGPTAVCEFATGKWSVFDSIEKALETLMPPDSRLRGGDYPSMMPFSSDEDPPKIAFISSINSGATLKLFKNKQWYEWPVTEISDDDSQASGTPFFREDGALVVPLSHHFWVFGDDDTWVKEEKPDDQPPEPTYDRDPPDPPEDCPISNVRSVVYDRHGICWLSDADGGLWKCLPGCAVPLLDEKESSSSILFDRQKFYRICTDNLGNAFIRLDFSLHGSGTHLAIKARYPLPDNQPKILRVKDDELTLHLGKAAWKRWRINGGEWSLATDDAKTSIKGLSPGDHQIEVLGYNAELTPSETSALLPFSVTVIPKDELRELLTQLKDGDLDVREAAARKLQSQGRIILDEIRAATSTDDSSYQWWLNAVIQSIEDGPQSPAGSKSNE